MFSVSSVQVILTFGFNCVRNPFSKYSFLDWIAIGFQNFFFSSECFCPNWQAYSSFTMERFVLSRVAGSTYNSNEDIIQRLYI